MFVRYRFNMRLTDRTVLFHLATLETPASMRQIAGHLCCEWKTVHRAIKRMSAMHYVNIVGGGRGKPYTYKINREQLPDDIRAELFR